MSLVIAWVSYVTHLLLLWRALHCRIWGEYPLFATYFAYITIRSSIILTHGDWNNQNQTYSLVYWWSELGGQVFWVLIPWEVFRKTFPKGSRSREVAGWGIAVLLCSLALLFGYGIRPRMWLFDALIKVALAVAGTLLLILLFVKYYGIPLGRNLWGIVVGAGINESAAIANYAAFDIYLEPFFPWWQKIKPASFVIMLIIWTWALWRYDPNPGSGPPPEEKGQLADWWGKQWKELDGKVKKAAGNE